MSVDWRRIVTEPNRVHTADVGVTAKLSYYLFHRNMEFKCQVKFSLSGKILIFLYCRGKCMNS